MGSVVDDEIGGRGADNGAGPSRRVDDIDRGRTTQHQVRLPNGV